ncbi:uncharacterized protein LOC122038510 isoform X1 [Zingiber officinale]|uniref:uncharacterized protein LOC122038510 isoform X1 n=1 Tax=Zingiber officinale TaxID=94328 RepID=UPI001C4C178A|nr:uncharacterized protein LOC122038510 isoform X1 [Zingiber officinale]
MEHGDDQLQEEASPVLPSIESLNPPLLPASIGLGFVLASLVLVRSESLKPVTTAIKLADNAIKGTQVLSSPSPKSLLLASKAIVKGYRATKRFVPVGFDLKLPPAERAKLKACLGAASLLKHTRSPLLAGGSLGVGFLKGGYNISKNCVKVLEGFIGLQLNSAVREGIDALGLAVRVATVGKEIKRLLLIEWQKRTQIECLILGGDSRPGVRLSYKRCNFDRFHVIGGDFGSQNFPFMGKTPFDEMDLEMHLSELLCMSIPVYEVFLGLFLADLFP